MVTFGHLYPVLFHPILQHLKKTTLLILRDMHVESNLYFTGRRGNSRLDNSHPAHPKLIWVLVLVWVWQHYLPTVANCSFLLFLFSVWTWHFPASTSPAFFWFALFSFIHVGVRFLLFLGQTLSSLNGYIWSHCSKPLCALASKFFYNWVEQMSLRAVGQILSFFSVGGSHNSSFHDRVLH